MQRKPLPWVCRRGLFAPMLADLLHHQPLGGGALGGGTHQHHVGPFRPGGDIDDGRPAFCRLVQNTFR